MRGRIAWGGINGGGRRDVWIVEYLFFLNIFISANALLFLRTNKYVDVQRLF